MSENGMQVDEIKEEPVSDGSNYSMSEVETEAIPTSMNADMKVETKKRVHNEDSDSEDAKRIKTEDTTNAQTPTPAYTSPRSASSQPITDASPPLVHTVQSTPTTQAAPNKLTWLDKLSALHLTEVQKEALEKAKAFAREMQSVLLKSTGKPSSPPPIPSILLTSNPGLASGIDPRSLSVLSRIYVGSINFELTEQHLRVVFGQFGAIKSVSMSLDAVTGKHKGFCFIEFETPEGASLALESMNGAELGGRQLKVGRPNNYTAATAAGLLPPPKTRIYVSNVNEYVSEDNLMSIFEAFGKINACVLMPDLITRKHKGYGFIEFEDGMAASTAVVSMNNFELGGLILHVGKAVIGGPLPEGMKAIEKLPPLPAGMSPAMPLATPSVSAAAAAVKAQNAAAKIAAGLAARGQSVVESVAQEENMSISASQRYAIMQKLARQETSPVILIQNAVAPMDVDDSLEEEFEEECSNFGKVSKVAIHVDRESVFEGEQGVVKIFVQFEDASAADKAREKLDGRWFGGRRIKATLFDLKKFQKGDYST
ncbi:6936_t:CDS:2 [Paraglomus brasilianum]|uniref:6936_t:CDS:1 n=1 Tax=Paraglomus brasilianum TaxID=144538 RepID=A0A9N9BDS8_9GLOM|nr:6936_t:CDS:2 [Paraglomus brasilianum]